jgi:hypothetical protein
MNKDSTIAELPAQTAQNGDIAHLNDVRADYAVAANSNEPEVEAEDVAEVYFALG